MGGMLAHCEPVASLAVFMDVYRIHGTYETHEMLVSKCQDES